MKLYEVLDTQLSWEWTSNPGGTVSIAEFTDSGFDYEVVFKPGGYIDEHNERVPSTQLMFISVDEDGNESMDITGTDNAYPVFATVAQILKSYLNSKRPESIFFSAKEKSRKKLYDRLSKRLIKAGWIRIPIPETHPKVYAFAQPSAHRPPTDYQHLWKWENSRQHGIIGQAEYETDDECVMNLVFGKRWFWNEDREQITCHTVDVAMLDNDGEEDLHPHLTDIEMKVCGEMILTFIARNASVPISIYIRDREQREYITHLITSHGTFEELPHHMTGNWVIFGPKESHG